MQACAAQQVAERDATSRGNRSGRWIFSLWVMNAGEQKTNSRREKTSLQACWRLPHEFWEERRLFQQRNWVGTACRRGLLEASKMRRVRLKARESVSLMVMDLAVLGKPKARERLSNLRAWMALRDSE